MKESKSGIPLSLTPFFQEYDLEDLDLHYSQGTIIERTLRFGNRAELRWLFSVYPGAEIADWVAQWGDYALPEPHLTFWRLILSSMRDAGTGEYKIQEMQNDYFVRRGAGMTDLHWHTISPSMQQVMDTFGDTQIGEQFYLAGGTALALQIGHRRSVDLDFFSSTEDITAARELLFDALGSYNPILSDTTWGNLLFVVGSVEVGFYAYGYPMVAPFLKAGPTRMASIPDIGLMKLDTLLARASRKDFHDLYTICQQIPLRELLDLAPRKYSNVRDFEAQVVRRLTYFERADQEAPIPLIQEVSWSTVKDFFRQQAIILGSSWLE